MTTHLVLPSSVVQDQNHPLVIISCHEDVENGCCAEFFAKNIGERTNNLRHTYGDTGQAGAVNRGIHMGTQGKLGHNVITFVFIKISAWLGRIFFCSCLQSRVYSNRNLTTATGVWPVSFPFSHIHSHPHTSFLDLRTEINYFSQVSRKITPSVLLHLVH